MGIWTAVFWCLVMGLAIGLINGFMVTVLEVPAFIATLTMLFIGRGVILGVTGGKNIAFEIKAGDYPAFFHLGEINAFGFNNQIILFIITAAIAAAALAYTTIGWTTYSVGGNEQAARYAGINTRFVRMRSYVLSSLCAVIAGLMSVAQNKDADPLAGFGWSSSPFRRSSSAERRFSAAAGESSAPASARFSSGSSTRFCAKACPPPARSISATARPRRCRR